MTGRERETALLQTFVAAAKRDRFVEMLGTRKGREKLRRGLDHFTDLDPTRCTRIAGGDQTSTWIRARLRALGAPATCYILSSNSDLDGLEMELVDALDAIIGLGSGSFVCCIPGKLAYFEGESQGERYLCQG
jgi:hypothetical protein